MDAEQRARLDERAAVTVSPDMPWVQARPILDLRALLAAYDAAVAERDQAREHVKLLEDVMRSDETLNRLQAFNTQLQRANASLIHARDTAEARATHLAALEQRAVDVVEKRYYNGGCACGDCMGFRSAVANLAAPTGETRSANDLT